MKPLMHILPYLRRYRGGIAMGLLMVVLANAFHVLLPWLLGRAIDALGEPGTGRGTLAVYAALIVGTAVLGGAARFGMRQILNTLSRRVEVDLRDDFFAHLVRLDAPFYGATRTGDLMSRATNDTQAVRMAIGPGIMYLVNTFAMTALALFFMFRYSASLTLVALIPLLALPPAMLHFGRVIHRRFERIQEHLGHLSTMVQENLSGVRIVRAYRQEESQQAEFEELNAQYLEKNMDLARTSALFHPLLQVFTGLGMLAVLWVGGLQVMAGTITAGDFVAFGFYLVMLTWPMVALGWVINLFQRGAASMARINRIMEARPQVTEPAHPRALERTRGEVEFRNVSFRYPGTERWVLRDVSFRIPAGSTAALVGPTAAGKSTVVHLLTRRYDPAEGQVLLDGVPLDELSFATLRAAVGVVPQDAFVFSDTIAANVGLGLDGGPDDAARVEAAVRVARLDEAIAAFPRGLETRLGERGVNLSGGQRQRATLARALAMDPPVLILDDALSAVDTHTETEILRGLRTVMAERTALIVSHRVSAVMGADLILVLDEGRVVERGVHTDLIRAGGLYATLLRRQLLAEGLEGEPLAGASDRT